MTIKLTKKRTQILDTLKQHKGTLTAKELHQQLPEIDLVTIYRNLDLFVKEKLITQVNLGGGEVQYEHQHEPHHHAVCNDCERVIHFTAPDKELKKVLGIEDFDIDEIEVTVRGVCRS